MDNVIGRLEAVCSRLENAVGKMGGGGGNVDEDGIPAYVSDYNAIVSKELNAVVLSCGTLKIKACGTTLRKSFGNVGALIAVLHKTAKPKQEDLMTFLKEAVAAIEKAEKLKRKRDKRGKPDMGSHRAALYDVCTMCSWVLMSPPGGLPAPYIMGQIDSAQFHLNRVLKNAKGSDNEGVAKEFVTAVKALGTALHGFVKANFKTGLEWKVGGGDLLASPTGLSEKPTSEKANTVAESKDEVKEEVKEKPAVNMGNVFGEISKGLKITKGLKNVKKSQKTKYRKKEEGRGLIKVGPKKVVKKKPKRPPMTKNMGGRWMFADYYEGVVEVPEAVNMKTNIFVSSCTNCQMEIKQKVKAISLESCKKMVIIVNDVVSSVEMVRCDSVTIYCKGVVPSMQIDKCESPTVIVLKGAKNPEMVVSCCTAGNVEVFSPTEEEPDRMVAFPMPEQFKLQIADDNSGLFCKEVEHG